MAWSTPPMFTTREHLVSADLNIIRDDLLFLRGDAAWTNVGSFSNSWVNYGLGTLSASYRLIGDRVLLRGAIKSGTVGSAAFTLPSGYRPTGTIILPALSNGAIGRLDIDSSGNVIPGGASSTGSNVVFALDGVVFSAV